MIRFSVTLSIAIGSIIAYVCNRVIGSMNTIHGRKPPPLWLVIIPVFVVLSAMSIGLTLALKLPWRVPISPAIGLAAGIPILAFGFGWMIWTLRSLSVRRAFGKELFTNGRDSTLVTTGPYSLSRNPLYFSAAILFVGWFLVLRWTPIAILTVLFLILFMLVGRWEQRELTERFGKAYQDYKQRVPFFIPGRILKKP